MSALTERAELFRHLPVELFQTADRCYAFDVNKAAFVEIDAAIFQVLTYLRDAPLDVDGLRERCPDLERATIEEAIAAIGEVQRQGWFQPRAFRRARRHEDHSFRETLSRAMAGLTIFVTTQCNLGCSYCIYGGQYDQHQELTQQPMSWETLRAAMDFLEQHSRDAPSVRVDYFGGEPLMAFAMIRRATDYLRDKVAASGRETIITITTNGTILTPPILDFLVENRIYVQFSIDGNEAVHDGARPYKGSNRPSFARIMQNLRKIEARDAAYFSKYVRVKAVITNETVNDADRAFFDDPAIRTLIERGGFSFVPLEPHYDVTLDEDYFASIANLARLLAPIEGAVSEADLLRHLNPKQRDIYTRTFGKFFTVQAMERGLFLGAEAVPFAKGCMTGYQEGAVNAAGDISICLKSSKGDAFVIGNVHEGEWHYDRIEDLNAKFHDDWADCGSCFAQRFCDLCYEKIAGDPDDWYAGRRRFCTFNRDKHRRIFGEMLAVMDRNPALWDNLDQIVGDQAARLRAMHRGSAVSEQAPVAA